MDLKLRKKLHSVSGSTAGIGFATAKRLLEEGARVIINGRTKHSVDKAVEELKTTVRGSDMSGI